MQKLSRDTRDTLFLVCVVALTVAPHMLRIPLWAGASLLLLLGWRVWLAWGARPLPNRWLLMLILAAACGAAKVSHGVLVGRDAGLTLVTLLMALKLLEMHKRRDAFVVFFLGFFLVLTQFLHSQALWVALWTVATVWGLLTSLVLAQMPLGQPHLKIAAREAARTTLYGLPVMVLLFLLFPRMAPLWGVPSASAGTGLSNEMEFGQVATLASDDSVALRLRPLDGQTLPPPQWLYFRGPVLTDFDGLSWRARPPGTVLPPGEAWQRGLGPALRYEMLVEPQRVSLLPVLEYDAGQPGELWQLPSLLLRRSAELSWIANRPITERLRLQHEAQLSSSRLGPFEEHPSLRPARRLPPGLNPRLTAWARELAQGRSTDELLAALLTHIRREPFRYTLTPGVYGEASPHLIDEFWFDRRAGFCEHYAAATVVALRAAGVPARLVTGYQGMDPELQDGWAVVRNSHAHAWIEYWQPQIGWRRADPTAAVAPERVERSQRLSPPPGALRGALDAIDPTLWARMRRIGEALDLQWQQWVLGYARDQQFDLLRRLGFEEADWTALGHAVAIAIGSLALGALAWMRWRAHEHNPWVRLHQRTLRALQRAGLTQAQPHQAPLRWAALAGQHWGARAAALQAQLAQLEQRRYGPQAELSPWQALRWRQTWWRGLQRSLPRGLGDTAPPSSPSS
ncbi:DUF3488 and transglutaminase-like domain-containing protein [Inhella proteolytica]|uniref:DUF3488 domain-containing transglutaminase family protein n=1 Tax=Inhella proteolytica TaxID=2795029 RepID=A0A931NF86_9BURK|nr:DUF3488 and transglutaminase-like domain-containing protein [Inhella proteolytica]MBH9575373.1 DUF3488 domain-containing transglutaminase family protein [Inhella proteolytica]